MSPKGANLKSALLCLSLVALAPAMAADAPALYQKHCAECHNAQRLGGMGPALLPGNLKRLRKKAAVDVISNGRIATQMQIATESAGQAVPTPSQFSAMSRRRSSGGTPSAA